MKIAFCLFRYFPYGGLQRDFLRIAAECKRRGHESCAYTLDWQGERPEWMNVRVCDERGVSNHTRYSRFGRTVARHLESDPVDVVVGFNRMPGLDVYYAADTCYEWRSRKYRPWWYRLLPRYRSFSAAERSVFGQDSEVQILLVSARQKGEFQEYYSTRDTRFHVLPPGISRDRMAPADGDAVRAAFRSEYDLGPDDLLVLMVGSGFKTKGVDRSIQAIRSLSDDLLQRTRLFIVGEDDRRPFVRMVQRLKLDSRVQFMGGRDDVPRFLLGSDLLVHPAYNENTGTVLLEAVASGLPVLASDVCGYAHFILEAEAGLLIPSPFVQENMNRLLEQALTSPLRESWKANGLRFGRKADIYSLPERAADIIEDVGNRKPGRGNDGALST